MSIEKFLQDGQDAKVVEKIHDKIVDMLTAGEYIQYISLQKKPAVTLLPDSITVSNKRIFLCEFTKLGLATNFEIFSWENIKDIAFKEEIFGSKVTVIPFTGENLTIDYIPKVQARKLYQLIKEALEHSKDPSYNEVPAESNEQDVPVAPFHTEPTPVETTPEPEPVVPAAEIIEETVRIYEDTEEPKESVSESQPTFEIVQNTTNEEDDELTKKLQKLKKLYDRQLITQAEYENKKSELLAQL